MRLIGPQLQVFLIDVLRLSLWLTILVVIFVPLERLFAAHPKKVWRKGIPARCNAPIWSELAIRIGTPRGKDSSWRAMADSKGIRVVELTMPSFKTSGT